MPLAAKQAEARAGRKIPTFSMNHFSADFVYMSMNMNLLMSAALFLAQQSSGGTGESLRTSTKTPELPYTIDVIEVGRIKQIQPRVSTDVLRGVTSVLSQKTAYGQGSPFIRGWTGFNTLMLVDGIRLNNSVFRFGPNQYWATVDPFIMRRVDVIKGPASTLYGSDAVGGTVYVTTKGPFDLTAVEGFYPEATYRFASAERSNMGRLESAYLVSNELGFSGGVSYKNFGDFVGGGDMGVQDETGFTQADGDVKFVYRPGLLELTLAYQKTFQDDVPRTHKTIHAEEFHGTKIGKELERDLDQLRELTYIKLRMKELASFADEATLNLSLHTQGEFETRTKSDASGKHQGFNVNTFGSSLQLTKELYDTEFVYGAEYYLDTINSFAREYSAAGSLKSHGIQGPIADNATYASTGIFVQDTFRVADDLTVMAGLRYSYFDAEADDVNVNGARQEFDDNWNAIVGSLRLNQSISSEVGIYGGVSQGFRTPNIADVSKLDDTSAVELPSLDLDEERFTSYEAGLRMNSGSVSGYVAYWYTSIQDLIVQSPTGAFVGGTQVVRKDNVGDGYVNGIELSSRYRVLADITLSAAFSRMFGRVEQLDEKAGFSIVKAPLSRLMPMTLELGADFTLSPDASVFCVGRFVDNQDRLALRDKNDTSRIPPGGTPGYAVFDLGFNYRITDALEGSVKVENLLDKEYRVHGSGSNEPGFNVIVSLTSTF